MRKADKNDIMLINTVINSMKDIFGEYSNIIVGRISGLIVDEEGRVVDSVIGLKTVLPTLIRSYETVIGSLATKKIADSLRPYISSDKRLKSLLPKSILDDTS